MALVNVCCLLAVTLLIVDCQSQDTDLNTAGISNSFSQKFSNGREFDLNALLRSLNVSTTFIPPKSNAFTEADAVLENNPSAQVLSNIFSQSSGNEFVVTNNVSDTAATDVNHLRILVDRTGIDTAQSFDQDGNPVDQGVAAVSSQRLSVCPYDQANSQPCNSVFREPTARCTNTAQGRKTWGMAGTPYPRILAPKYEDGVGERRLTGHNSGQPLKSAREVSTLVTTVNVHLDSRGVNAQIMQWGQFVAHEFTQLSESEAGTACCPDQIFRARSGVQTNPTRAQLELIREEVRRERGDICMQIERHDDPVYMSYVCMSQTRSRPAPLHDCSIGPRQQMNAVTHVFDGSNVYGSSKAEADKLREMTGGRMKVQTVNGAILPPPNLEGCPPASRNANRCPFLGGDSRINTTPNLIATHAVMLVKHNQIATALGTLNRQWDDERIYQEAKRIISAIEMNIHYNEYLPIIIGSAMMDKYRISRYSGFNDSVNPSVLNELAGAAMRYGHSMIDGFFTAVKDSGPSNSMNLRELFGNSTFIYDGGIKQCIKGLQIDEPWVVDRNYPEQMTQFMFDEKNDIVSMNINRGRDHGFESYVEYRKHYDLPVPQSFSDLSKTHPPDVVAALTSAYSHVGDIELYIGGVTENLLEGAFVGELFANILGDGFSRLMSGDRFYFESAQSGLSTAQISAIKAYKYHNLLCDGAGLITVSSKAFFRVGFNGASSIPCSSLTPLNMDLWREVNTPEPSCSWTVTDTSECCFGRRTVRRRCVGDSDCQCPGLPQLTEACHCVNECWSWTRCGKSVWDSSSIPRFGAK